MNRESAESMLDDGRVLAGTTVYRGRVGCGPPSANWPTTAADLDLLVDVVLQLGTKATEAVPR